MNQDPVWTRGCKLHQDVGILAVELHQNKTGVSSSTRMLKSVTDTHYPVLGRKCASSS
jgi:hypothetical protein